MRGLLWIVEEIGTNHRGAENTEKIFFFSAFSAPLWFIQKNRPRNYWTMPNRFRVSASVSAINPSEMTAP